MNNFAKYLCMGALGLGLWSCAADEPVSTEIPKFEGNQAAMTIKIYAPSDRDTRADGGAGDYVNGTANENEVRKLNFYFYDKAGDYVTCYEGATYTPLEGSTGSALVEEIGQSRIILTDLLGQNYPSYVVAVLNYNINAQPGQEDTRFKRPLSEVTSVVRESSNPWSIRTVNGVSTVTDFVMTSATHSGNDQDGYYFATPITEENFALQPGDANANQPWPDEITDADGNKVPNPAKPVEIFVERLASKVQLNMHSSFELKTGKELDAEGNEVTVSYYEKVLPDDYEIDGKKTKLTVRLYGWGVNGQAKKTRYFKAVNDGSKEVAFKTSDGWNFDGTNRSYWARTPGYGENKYPSSFNDVSNKTGEPFTPDDDDAANSEPLKYISWNSVKSNAFTGVQTTAYIMPHTEVGAQINLAGNNINHPAITEILVAGRIVDSEGKPVTLYQLSESYYTKDGVINYLLNAAKAHIWKKTADNKYTEIEPSDVDVKYGYDGTFHIVLTEAAQKETWYQDNEGKEKWVDAAVVANEINAFLPDQQSFCYNDGMLYYNIPIRHLRDYKTGDEIKTGMFGVVRNHWYQVTINSITKLGHSVYRPDEHIIPPSDDTRYMIGSSIKVLSWRVVKSSANL